jgi:hypothetical protein
MATATQKPGGQLARPRAPVRSDLFVPRTVQSDLGQEIDSYLHNLTIGQLLCLAYGHDWPVLIPELDVPQGFRAVPSPGAQGVYLVTEECLRLVYTPGRRKPLLYSCGTVRKSMTLPSRMFDSTHKRQYGYDDSEWEIRPPGSRLTRIDFLNEIYRRMGHKLFPVVQGEVIRS